MRPEDFFKSVSEIKESDSTRVELNYAERLIKKYFESCISRHELKAIMTDSAIAPEDKQYAVREIAEGILKDIHFVNVKTELPRLLFDGVKNPAVKKFLDVVEEFDCDIMVFPVLKTGNWVIHSRGMSNTADKTPRIIIPGDGCLLTIQTLDNFVKEYLI